jgi:hypothetical protein
MSMMDGFEEQVRGIAMPPIINAADWLEAEPPEPDQIIKDILDVKDKLVIIGSSKMRKTFLHLQFIISIAAGRPILKWDVPKPRRVVHIQYEIQENHYHRRFKRMCQGMGITRSDIEDRLFIINARGMGLTGTDGLEKIESRIKQYKPELISFDPFYKLSPGAENAIDDIKPILESVDKLIMKTGAAVAYVHHDAKGFSGDRDIRDRGAGSNIIGRDYDACITMDQHISEKNAVVLDILLRNYPPQESFTAKWSEDEMTGGYSFNLAAEVAPTKKTSKNSNTKTLIPLESYLPAAKEILKDGPMPVRLFDEKLRDKAGLTVERSKNFRAWATTNPEFDMTSERARAKNKKLIGLTSVIAPLTA